MASTIRIKTGKGIRQGLGGKKEKSAPARCRGEIPGKVKGNAFEYADRKNWGRKAGKTEITGPSKGGRRKRRLSW